jgi:predicted O-linked N-acetylglucosamine transferase (SPINDLY family)
MSEPSQQHAFERALAHHGAGRLREAELLYRAFLREQPRHALALHNLAVIALQNGHPAPAVELLRQAAALDPADVGTRIYLAHALCASDRGDQALPILPTLRNCTPEDAPALLRLGLALQQAGFREQAIGIYRQTIQLAPAMADAHCNLGDCLRAQGLPEEALAAFENALAANPRHVQSLYNLAVVRSERGEFEASIALYHRVLEIDPRHVMTLGNLGNLLCTQDQTDRGIELYRRAIAIDPSQSLVHYNLALALQQKRLIDESLAAYRDAISADPDNGKAWNNLANLLADTGDLDTAISAYRTAIQCNPTRSHYHGNLIFHLHQLPGCDSRIIASELRDWDNNYARPLRPSLGSPSTFLDRDRNPDRPLRVGYVSSDFWAHASALFLVPLFQHHTDQVETFCYCINARVDDTTARMRSLVQHWRDISNQSDEAAAAQIRADQIDILVDLKLHTAENRLLLFARKPAPVQITWLGYPGSTGLAEMDYRLSDPYLDPPERDPSVYSEQKLLLPDTFWCYDPLDGADLHIGPLPALRNGYITFGCLNNFSKINPMMLSIWAQAMRKLDGSRLLLRASPGGHRRRTLDHFSKHGIDSARIDFVDFLPRRQYLQLYNEIDITLDSHPYNGHTTSLDSFWMGVPVVSLVGQTAVSRAGLSQLSNLGLQHLAADSPERFADNAIDLASDLPRLEELRRALRNRMQRSPLMDHPRFARNMEAAYRIAWRKWCGKPTCQP